MKQKIIQFLLVLLIVLMPIVFIFMETTELSVRYIAIVFSVLSSLFSVFISSIILRFIYKIFINFSKETIDEIQTLFLGYIFLNSIIALALKDTSFFYIFNVINPVLIIFLSIITFIYYKSYDFKKLFYASIVFYIANFVFALIGVMMNSA